MKQSAVPSGKRWRQNASTSKTTSFFAYLLKFRNMYRFYLLYCLFLCLGNILFAQTTGFEKGVPQSFCTVQSNELSSSEEFYKEGKRSLAWQFSPRSVLTVKLDTPLHLDSISKEKRGITLWIYNEQARKDSLRFEFFSPNLPAATVGVTSLPALWHGLLRVNLSLPKMPAGCQTVNCVSATVRPVTTA